MPGTSLWTMPGHSKLCKQFFFTLGSIQYSKLSYLSLQMKDKQRHGILLHAQLSITMDNFYSQFPSNFSSNNAIFSYNFSSNTRSIFLDKHKYLILQFLLFSEFHRTPHLKQLLFTTRTL
jgi:hypothetical protein